MKYTITQASNILNCKPYLLRFYEDEFELKIPRGNNNRRYYTTKEIDIFRYIEALKDEGKKNKEIKETLFDSKEQIIFEEIKEEAPVEEENNITCLIKTINSLRQEIESLKKEDTFKERDELIAENARMKMKLKEKTYELTILKEKYNTLKNSRKRSLFKL